jgi:hypothetical protein
MFVTPILTAIEKAPGEFAASLLTAGTVRGVEGNDQQCGMSSVYIRDLTRQRY